MNKILKKPDNLENIIFVIYDLCTTIEKKITDYRSIIHNNKDLKSKFYNIEYVYIHSIILDLAKVLGVVDNDKASIKQLMNMAPKNIKSVIKKIEIDYQKIILKIKNNRNRIISHVDISKGNAYFDMGLSKLERGSRIKDFINYIKIVSPKGKSEINKFAIALSKNKSKSVKDERYSPSDFFRDCDNFLKITNEIKVINWDINQYYYR